MNDSYVRVENKRSRNQKLITSDFEQENKQKNNKQIEVKEKSFSIKVYSRIFKYSFKYKFLFITANLGLLVTALCQTSVPYLCGQIIDAINKNDSDSLTQLCIKFFLISIISGVFGFLRGFSYNLLGSRVVRDLRQDLFTKLIRKDVEFYDRTKTGELLSRIGSDVSVIENTSTENVSMIVRNLLSFFVSFSILFATSWSLTLYILLVIPPIVIGMVFFRKYFRRLSKEYQNSIADSSSIATEVFGNIRVVKSFSTENREIKKYSDKIHYTYNIGYKKSLIYGLFIFLLTVCALVAVLFVLWIGGNKVLLGEITSGELSSFILYTVTLSTSIRGMSTTITQLINSTAISEKIFELMDLPTKIYNNRDEYMLAYNFNTSGNIDLKDVCFSYPSRNEVQILSHVNLSIKSGEKIAIVGSSGSGKSTIVSLIERFYDVDSGQILFENVDLKKINLEILHKQIGFVSQEPTLFSGTIKENIVYGVEKYTEEDITEAINLANASEFINDSKKFPSGLNSIVGERGIQLSGGQKQRVAIARALIKKPKILIFDEATSALDSESEYQVQKAIDSLMTNGESTIIIIAHRLSTIINCDRILVMKNGEIVEKGSHKELLRLDGFYKSLVERQLSSFIE